ncbi:hypothetical protein BDW59DRAFT_166824 [Aspergillus cavernicola]|uniref:G domain-containing protein n=1 Tax=Aspergillus cavernicola TaxID=176166 RepID=A0ABR4HIV5_9EURO
MDILSSTAQQLTDQAQRLSTIFGLTKSSPHDRFFIAMGKTGSGESSFVARCTGKDVTVGHGLYSCTSSIDTYSYTLPPLPHQRRKENRQIPLIDTPGFNDTNRSDIEMLSILASYFGASYANGVSIHGILILHPITDNRVGGSSMRNVEMMKKMCGWASSASAFSLGVGMQGQGQEERGALEKREAELLTEQRFLGELVAGGAGIFKDNEDGRRDINGETLSACYWSYVRGPSVCGYVEGTMLYALKALMWCGGIYSSADDPVKRTR